MKWFRRGAGLRPASSEEDSLTSEIQDYLDRQTQQNIDEGMTPEEARLAALRKLGPVTRVIEETREAATGGVWLWLEMIWQDLRHGCRMFAKNPGFTLAAVLSIALGAGANVAMFSAADALLLRPLPVPRSGEIVVVGTDFSELNFSSMSSSYPNYVDLRDRNRSFGGLLAFHATTAGFAADPAATAQVKVGMVVTGNFLQVLGVQPELGRSFRPEEDQVPGRDAVVILSHGACEQLGSDPKILGHAVRIAGIEFTVIGVTPESFIGPDRNFRPAFYVPMMMWPRLSSDPQTLEARDRFNLTIKGRLKPGVSLTQAQAELDTIARDLERAHPDTNRNLHLTVRTQLQMNIRENRVYTALAAILTLLAAAVLIVACANVAGLLTSRAPLRAREIALRLAVGAGRPRLIRQLLTESGLIAAAGGLLGLPLAYIGISRLRQIQFPTDLIMVPRIDLDRRALLFSLAVAMGSVILFGLIPAIQTTRANLTTALKASSALVPGTRGLWGRNLLVAVQVAVSLLLLTIALFSYRLFGAQLDNGMGFRADHMLMMDFNPGVVRYTDARSRTFFEDLIKRAESLPGVKSAALASVRPLGFLEPSFIQPEGFRFPAGQSYATVHSSRVDEHYFNTLGIEILHGRAFTLADSSGAPRVAIVNEVLANDYWPNQDPIGKRLRLLGTNNPPWVQIVGIAKLSRYGFIGEPPTEFLYLPYRQTPQGRMTLFAASAGDSVSLLAPLRDLVRDLDPNLPTYDVQTMEHYYWARATSIAQVTMEIVGGMGVMGLVLAMVGLYALMSYSVSRRTREIGIRMAVGASHLSVLRMVLRQGMVPALCGIPIGLVLSAGAARLLTSSFPLGYRLGPAIYGAVAPLMLLVATLAAYAPARRASLVDPMMALREE
jgi:predicted permease